MQKGRGTYMQRERERERKIELKRQHAKELRSTTTIGLKAFCALLNIAYSPRSMEKLASAHAQHGEGGGRTP